MYFLPSRRIASPCWFLCWVGSHWHILNIVLSHIAQFMNSECTQSEPLSQHHLFLSSPSLLITQQSRPAWPSMFTPHLLFGVDRKNGAVGQADLNRIHFSIFVAVRANNTVTMTVTTGDSITACSALHHTPGHKDGQTRDFSGTPVVNIPCFQGRRCGFHLWLGN